MSKQIFTVVLISILGFTTGEIADHHEYCDVNNNEFYLPQGDICKKCDRCGSGFGIESLKVLKAKFLDLFPPNHFVVTLSVLLSAQVRSIY